MRCLNEPIARWANREDNCTGRFWEGRFKSQALLDERALVSCMAYVDLNPIRACMADRPEISDYTSIQERLGIEPAISTDAQLPHHDDDKREPLKLAELLPFAGNEHITNKPEQIPFDLMEYIQLVDWTGRAVREGKRGAISENLPSILDRLGIAPDEWIKTCCHIERNFGRAIGPVAKITELCDKLGQRWIHGLKNCRRFYAHQAV